MKRLGAFLLLILLVGCQENGSTEGPMMINNLYTHVVVVKGEGIAAFDVTLTVDNCGDITEIITGTVVQPLTCDAGRIRYALMNELTAFGPETEIMRIAASSVVLDRYVLKRLDHEDADGIVYVKEVR